MAIEVAAGDVKNQVKLLCRHMVAGGIFAGNTHPTDDDLDDAIETCEGEILTWVASFGGDTDTSLWPVVARAYLSWYNALGAAYHVELGHTGLSTAAGPGTRAETYYRLYMALYEQLKDGLLDLGDIGIPTDASTTLQASITGVSHADKEVLTSDSDAVQPSFKRDQFKNPGTHLPSTSSDL